MHEFVRLCCYIVFIYRTQWIAFWKKNANKCVIANDASLMFFSTLTTEFLPKLIIVIRRINFIRCLASIRRTIWKINQHWNMKYHTFQIQIKLIKFLTHFYEWNFFHAHDHSKTNVIVKFFGNNQSSKVLLHPVSWSKISISFFYKMMTIPIKFMGLLLKEFEKISLNVLDRTLKNETENKNFS